MAKRAIVEARVALALRLVALPAEALTAFDLTPDLGHALDVARRLKASGAKQRQIRYVAKMMIAEEDHIVAVLDGLADGSIIPPTHGRLRASEVLEDPTTEIEAVLEDHPVADRSRLWQLVRQADADQLGAYLDSVMGS